MKRSSKLMVWCTVTVLVGLVAAVAFIATDNLYTGLFVSIGLTFISMVFFVWSVNQDQKERSHG